MAKCFASWFNVVMPEQYFREPKSMLEVWNDSCDCKFSFVKTWHKKIFCYLWMWTIHDVQSTYYANIACFGIKYNKIYESTYSEVCELFMFIFNWGNRQRLKYNGTGEILNLKVDICYIEQWSARNICCIKFRVRSHALLL